MEWRVKTWYKVYMAFVSSVSTFLVLYIFSLQISKIITLLVTVIYLFVLLITLEAFVLKIKTKGKDLRFLFHKVKLDDIIEVRCGVFSTIIRTRWKVYRVPPIESCKLLGKYSNSGT